MILLNYDTDGRILGWMDYDPPESGHDTSDLRAVNSGLAELRHGNPEELADKALVKDGQIVPRPRIQFTPKMFYRTAGGDTLDLPDELEGGAVQVFDGGGEPIVLADQLEKGAKLHFNKPGRYRIRVEKFPYQTFEVTIDVDD